MPDDSDTCNVEGCDRQKHRFWASGRQHYTLCTKHYEEKQIGIDPYE